MNRLTELPNIVGEQTLQEFDSVWTGEPDNRAGFDQRGDGSHILKVGAMLGREEFEGLMRKNREFVAVHLVYNYCFDLCECDGEEIWERDEVILEERQWEWRRRWSEDT